MSGQLESLQTMVRARLVQEPFPSPEFIRELIAQVRIIHPDVTNEDAEWLAREFEAVHGVTMHIGATLEDKGFEHWLDDARVGIDFYYWDRYRRLLGEEKELSGQVIATLDDVTDRTLGLLENPAKEGPWDRRGMVVGHVQSGKTANYTGLVCKAADAGYRVVIIIAGIHNNLRSQTQARIDEGFIGFDSSLHQAREPNVTSISGVGRYDLKRRPNAFTNRIKDFNRQTASAIGIRLANLKEPAVFVIKKNASTLANLIKWLKGHNAQRGATCITEPMLLIDDEADNASINIGKSKDEVSKINRQIRELLKVFSRSSYVGYTATPFANIFIDPESDDDMLGDDLFPRDFIVSLDPPDNYVGPSQVFLRDFQEQDVMPIVRHVQDHMDLLPLKHKKNHDVAALPQSLKDAIRAYVLAKTIRLVRGQEGQHNSMLVNASRFTNVQRQLRNEIHEFVRVIRQAVRVVGALDADQALMNPDLNELHRVFVEEYGDVGVDWSQVQERLLEGVSSVSVVEINSQSSGSLDYSKANSGLDVIAVGGFSLSRGLTLEDLLVSYFLRNSMMYDTLMQMGRWFGYRPGFGDLCRVWMTEEAEGWYSHIAESIEELREELRSMERAGATPKEFGLKVRSHPDNLIVTARNKMGSGEQVRVSIGLANQFIETTSVPEKEQAENRQAARTLVQSLRDVGNGLEDGESLDSGYLRRGVEVDFILEFLRAYRNAEGSSLTETDPLIEYIEKRKGGELAEWNLFVPSIAKPASWRLQTTLLGPEVICQRRTRGSLRKPGEIQIGNNQRVASRGIEKIDLSAEDREKAEWLFRTPSPGDPESAPGKRINYPDKAYRDVRRTPLLVLHLLSLGEEGEDMGEQEPVVAWSISFPESSLEERTVQYVVNTTWMKERYLEEVEEDEARGDDG